MNDDIGKLETLVQTKRDKYKHSTKEIQNLRKTTKGLEKDCEDLNECKSSIIKEIEGELELIDQIQEMIVTFKK